MRRWPSGSSPRRGRCTFDQELGLDLTNTVGALDSTTIALSDGRSFRGATVVWTTKAGSGSSHAHAARPAGQHSEFYPASRMPRCSDVPPQSRRSLLVFGSRSHLRRGSWLRRLWPAHIVFRPSLGLLRHACQVEHRRPSASPFARRRTRCSQAAGICLTRPCSGQEWLLQADAVTGLPRTSAAHLAWSRTTDRLARRWSSSRNNFSSSGSPRSSPPLYRKPLARGTLHRLQVDQAASSDPAVRTARQENVGSEDARSGIENRLRPTNTPKKPSSRQRRRPGRTTRRHFSYRSSR